MEGLPESQRTAMKMKHIEGLDVPEIAQRMGKTSRAVVNLLLRGRNTIREKMGQDTIDGER